MKTSLFFIISLFVQFSIYAHQFIYPVAVYDNTVLIAYQKTLTSFQLWSCNYDTGITEEVLGGPFMPLGVQMLPDKSGFSFIDAGRIRIKYFKDRVPKSVDLYNKPLSNINLLHWVDSRRCFFSAKYKSRYQIFQMTIDGYATLLVGQKHADCLYLQKVDNFLFYIERTKEKGIQYYRIMQTRYNQSSAPKKLILDFNQNAIMFLHMMSYSLGYVLEYPTDFPDQNKVINLTCHRLERGGGEWTRRRLFSFTIPLELIEGDRQLAESILPLLPKYHKDHIDFVHYHETALNIFRLHFDDENSSLEQLTFGKNDQHFFAPHELKSVLVYGRSIKNTLSNKRLDRIIAKN